MAKAAKKAIPIPEQTVQMTYRVTAKTDGFRRAGIVHAGVKEYGVDELSESQLAAIEAEPLLILERLVVPKTDGSENKEEGTSQEALMHEVPNRE